MSKSRCTPSSAGMCHRYSVIAPELPIAVNHHTRGRCAHRLIAGAAVIASAAISLAGPAPATLQGDLTAAAAYWHQNTPVRCSTEAVSYTELPRRVLGEATIPDPAQRTRARFVSR